MTGPERHRRWHEDERQTILAAAFAPGASVAEVARRHDVATSLIYKWRRQALLSNSDDTPFVPAVVLDDPKPASVKIASEDRTAIRVELPGGTRVSISVTAPASLITAALRALR